ncbi:HEAT repeat domain-containing protein [Natrinema sp. 74]|uniref:HEAT repeat domain-containing protein n=1 Tax=Natrinema sp. 74 TaxID=3384159 RepID=UPI0038D36FB6
MPDGSEVGGRIERLRSNDTETRRAAAHECYRNTGEQTTLDWSTARALAALTADPDHATRTYARGALTAGRSEWSDESDRVVNLLEAIVDDGGDDRERAVVVEHLARTPKTTVFVDGPVLENALAHEDPAVRRSLMSAVFACSRYDSSAVRESLDALLPSLSDPDPAVRASVTAVVALAVRTDDKALSAVIDQLNDSDPLVRRAAVRPLSEDLFYDVDEEITDRLLPTYVERVAACMVDSDPEVRRETDYLLSAADVRDHNNWRTAVLPILVEGFRKGHSERCRRLLEDLAEVDPDAFASHLNDMFDPEASVADRVTASRVVTLLLDTDEYPLDRAVPSLFTAVEEGTAVQQALETLQEIVKRHPTRVRDELDTLYLAVADGDRQVRSAAIDVLATLTEADPERVPAAVRALAEEGSLKTIVDGHPDFVAARVRELVGLLSEDPDRREQLYWTWWITDIVEVDPTILDAATEELADMIAAGGERRTAAADLLFWCCDDADLTPLVAPLQETLAEDPEAVPRGVLSAFESVVVERSALAIPVVDDLTAWLTHYEGRASAASVLEAVDESTDESLPPVARSLLEEGNWTSAESESNGVSTHHEDPLAVLAVVDPSLVEDELQMLIDRHCEAGSGDATDILHAIRVVYDTAPEIALTAVRRLDTQLNHYGRRLKIAEVFLKRVENGPSDLAGAGLGLLITALEYTRYKFRERVPPVLRRAVEAEPSAVADHVRALADYIDDNSEAVREAVHYAVVTAAKDDPAAVRELAVSAGETIASRPDGDEEAERLLSVIELLYDSTHDSAATIVSPIALDALLEVAGDFGSLDPADLFVPLARAAVPDPGEVRTESLADLTVVFTGSVQGYTRKEVQAAVEQMGGRVTSSVSGRTDLLVVGSDPGESKRRDAVQERVPMVRATALQNALDAASK